MTPRPEVVLVGGGIRVPDHLTKEGYDALETCKRIYTILPTSSIAALPKHLLNRTTSLWALYRTGAHRSDVYMAEVDTLLRAADNFSPIACLTQGNPLLLDSVSQSLLELDHIGRIALRIIPGLSSLDTVLSDAGYPIAPGMQIYDASSLLANKISVRADIPCLLMQVGVFGTMFVAAGAVPTGSLLGALAQHLAQVHPPEHECLFVVSPIQSNDNERVVRIRLGELDRLPAMVSVGAGSLLIPPSQRLFWDARFLHQMQDADFFSQTFQARLPATTS